MFYRDLVSDVPRFALGMRGDRGTSETVIGVNYLCPPQACHGLHAYQRKPWHTDTFSLLNILVKKLCEKIFLFFRQPCLPFSKTVFLSYKL
jgi:hypothetical protein